MLKQILRYAYNIVKWNANKYRVAKLRRKNAKIGSNVIISRGARIEYPQNLKLGNDVYIGNNFYSNCWGGLEIGDGSIISNNCTIMTYNHDYQNPHFSPYGLDDIPRKVKIGKNVWIGINVSINSGVEIGDGSIVGLGAVVPKSIKNNVIYGGYRILKVLEPKEKAYNTLRVRTIYSPWNYITFSIIIRRLLSKNKNQLTFSKIKTKYDKPDYISMIYRWSDYHKYQIDWGRETIKKR